MSSENFSVPAPTGIEPFDLFAPYCEECGRPTIMRLLYDGLGTQDCATCQEVATKHRCTERPHEARRAPGQEWECPDCDSIWRLVSNMEPCQDCCLDCDHEVEVRRWELAGLGQRYDTAPRYEPQVFTPMRNVLKGDRISGKPFPGLPY